MKILRQGVKPEFVWYGFCACCGCVFQLEKEDEKQIEYDQDCTAYFKCPCCNGVLRISWRNVQELDQFETK